MAEGLSEEEWEYEYDRDETEEFLVDLDLTTVNQTIRSTSANRRKRLNEIKDVSAHKRHKPSKLNDQTQEVSVVAEAAVSPDADAELCAPDQLEEQVQQDSIGLQHVQILDLSTNNPIAACGGQIFSCKWVDTVGTTMFFSQPNETALYDPELSTADYDMIGTSRIKIVGNAVKVTPTSQEAFKDEATRPGQSLGTIRRTNAKVNSDLRKQASFLDQLMNVKKDRGETDNVHVAMNEQIAKSASSGKLNARTQRLKDEIDHLNRKAVKGDAAALEKIEQIYLGQDIIVLDDDEPLYEADYALIEAPVARLSQSELITLNDDYSTPEQSSKTGDTHPLVETMLPNSSPTS